MEGVAEILGVAPGEDIKLGVAELVGFEIDQSMSSALNLRSLLNNDGGIARCSAGEYIKLYVDGQLMMSDTDMEKNSNREFVRKAHGDVMIAGLGIGLIINALRPKVESGKVTSITVYEKYQDVIDLIGPKYSDLPIKIICQDILTYKPVKGETYDTIYFDIWPEIDPNNLGEIRMLHNRWKFRKRPGGWMDSWMKEFLQYRRDQDRRGNYINCY